MAIKIQDQELENKIIELYNANNSIKKIGKELSISTSYINRVLQDHGIYKYINGINSNKKRNFELKDDKLEEWVAQCKKTNKIFNDFQNKSGFLTRHISELYPKLEIPKGYKKRQEEKKTGKFWFEEYFDIVLQKKQIIELKKCPHCDWETKDLENKSGAFTSHLSDIHNISVLEHITVYPEDKTLFKTFINKNNYLNETVSNKDNYINCKLCNKPFRKITNSHLKNKHNISLEEYRNEFSNTFSKSTYKKYKIIYDNHLKLHQKTYTSKGQTEVMEFLNFLNINSLINHKKTLKGVELDLYCPDYNIAIEYNGLLYHSEEFGKKDRNFHLNKTKLCNEKNITLIHIFEDEWILKKDIIKSKLTHIFNKTQNKIHARKCSIKQILNIEKNLFLDKNHLLGNTFSTISYGAYYNNELVAVMSLNNKRNMSNPNGDISEYELNRFCIKNFHSINGIGNRLLQKFISDYSPKKIISFAERTWTNFSDNNFYTNLGFKLIKKLPQDYKYFSRKVHNPVKLHKFQFGKKSLKKIFPHLYDDNKSEWEIMRAAGYDRIWDCGKFKYELNLS